MDMVTVLEQFVQGLTGSKRPVPDPSTLGSHAPDLNCLGLNPNFLVDGVAQSSRDKNGLVMQLQLEALTDFAKKLKDGGDSAHRTGLLAFCGSTQDKNNLPKYLIDLDSGGALSVRHPTDVPWNNPWNFTRDQLIGYLAGAWRTGQYDIAKALYKTHSERNPPFTTQSKEKDYPGTLKPEGIGDFLGAEDIMFFKICCGDYSAALDVLGQASLFIRIQLASSELGDEINQPLLMAIVCGQLDVFVKTHPNYREMLRQYWGRLDNFRYQPCIAEAMIEVVEIELTRYSSLSLIDWLIPKHVLDEMKDINIEEAIRQGRIINPVWYAEVSVRLAIALLKDVGDRLQMFANAIETGYQVVAEVQVILLKTSKHIVNEVRGICNRGDLGPVSQLAAPVLNAAAVILGLFAGDSDDAEEKEFRAGVRKDLSAILANSNIIIDEIKSINIKLTTLLPEFKALLEVTISEAFESEHLKNLRSDLGRVGPFLEAFEKEPTADRKDAIDEFVTSFDRSATRLLSLDEFKAASLPFAMQAFQGLVLALSTIGDKTLLVLKRNEYRAKFENSYLSAKGLDAQIRALRLSMSSIKESFNSMLGSKLLVVRAIQQYKKQVIWDPNLNEPIIWLIPTPTYDYKRHASHFSGKIDALDSIKGSGQDLSDLVLSGPPSSIRKSPHFQEITVNAHKVIEDFNPVWGDLHENDYVDVRKRHLDEMNSLSKNWTERQNELRKLEALAASATTIFGIETSVELLIH